MNKTFKTLVLTMLTVITAVCLCVGFVGCTPTEKKEKETFNITVVYPDGRAVNGKTEGTGGISETKVLVQLCGADGTHTQCDQPQDLGADGKIALPITSPLLKDCTKFHIKLSGLPQGYEMSEGADGLEVTAFGDYTMKLKAVAE